jgi:hypothetical protein
VRLPDEAATVKKGAALVVGLLPPKFVEALVTEHPRLAVLSLVWFSGLVGFTIGLLVSR